MTVLGNSSTRVELHEVVPRRRIGQFVGAALIAAGIAGLVYSGRAARVEWSEIPAMFTAESVRSGAVLTLKLTVAAEAIAIALGIIVAIMRISSNVVLRSSAFGFIWLFRGVPALLQILIWYNLALIYPTLSLALPGTGINLFNIQTTDAMTPFIAALLGLGLNEAAYMAEIVRAGIISVDHGQVEAASSIGLSPRKTFTRVVFPQAIRVIIPPAGNNFIGMLKASAIASVIGVAELIQAAQSISSRNLLILEAYLAVTIWYLIIVTVANVLQYFLERRYAFGRGRDGSPQRMGGALRLLMRR